MKISKALIFGILFSLTILACNKNENKIDSQDEIIVDNKENIDSSTIEVTGTIRKQGFTTYQYGTHTISGEGEYYALRSSSLNLDDYVSQNVTIVGDKVDGYPVDGGPDYLEVVEIE